MIASSRRTAASSEVSLNFTLPRLLFFQSLFEGYEVRWQDTRSRKDSGTEDGVYHLCIGSYKARSNAQLRDYLGHLGWCFSSIGTARASACDCSSRARPPSTC